MIQLPHKPRFERKWIEKHLSKTHYKKPYDRFMWWRGYTPKNKPLDKRSTFRDRIANGDFEQSTYLMEIELAYHTMNDKYMKCITTNGLVDEGMYRAEVSVDKARIKRLQEDFEKDEKNKLEEIRRGFVLNLKMTKEQYDKEVIKTGAKDLLTFYDRMSKKYGTYWKPLSYVGKT